MHKQYYVIKLRDGISKCPIINLNTVKKILFVATTVDVSKKDYFVLNNLNIINF